MDLGRARSFPVLILLVLGLLLAPAAGAEDEEELLDDIGSLDIEDLLEIEITSVSKSAESLFSAAAAVSVITTDEI